MLRHGPDALDLVGVRNIEGLNAAVVQDVPQLDHAFGVGCDEAVQIGQTIDADKGVLVPIEGHDWLLKVGVPDKDSEIEADTYEHLMLLTVGHLANGSIMAIVTLQRLYGRDRQVTENIVAHGLILEILHNHVLYSLLRRLLFGVVMGSCHLIVHIGNTVDLFLSQVP